jgi:hypothetical protein
MKEKKHKNNGIEVKTSKDVDDMDAKQIIAERGFSLQKVNFTDSEGNDCYACLLMKRGSVEKFKKAYEEGKVVLEDFGKVIFSGLGKEVPEFEKAFLDDMFGKGNW